MILYVVSILMYGGIYAILGLGLNLQFGLTGFVNLGFVAFFAVGAYASAIATAHGMPIILGPFLGLALAALAAYPVGRVVLRLEDDYLAIVSFGFAQVVQAIIINTSSLGGNDGITNVEEWFANVNAGLQPYLQLALVAAIAIVLCGVMYWLANSPYGRVLRAVRDDPVAARSLGKQAGRYRLAALVIGSGFAGIGGSLYAHYIGFISPSQFDSSLGFLVFTGIVIGGSSTLGAAVGTLLFVGFSELTSFLSDIHLPVSDPQIAQIRLILVGVALILVMQFRRQGLWPYHYQRRSRQRPSDTYDAEGPRARDVARQATH